MQKKTLVLGASSNEERHSNMAIKKLVLNNHSVVAIGSRASVIGHVRVVEELLPHSDIDTITVYLSEKNQKKLYKYILSLQPKRIIFNPGAENPELAALAAENNIETMNACTLVLLATKQF